MTTPFHLRDRYSNQGAKGHLSFWKTDRFGVSLLAEHRNQIQSGWAFAAAMLFGFGKRAYRIEGMYVEYENVASPEDEVGIPEFSVGDGVDYFNDLQLTSARDFLRVPLIGPPKLKIATGYEDYFNADAEQGNALTFFAVTQGTTGVTGKDFGNAANSKIIGGALIATPDWSDRSQDIIVARTYIDTADQFIKPAIPQVSVTWDLVFTF